jgi:uncharacterized protein (DUF302 family)
MNTALAAEVRFSPEPFTKQFRYNPARTNAPKETVMKLWQTAILLASLALPAITAAQPPENKNGIVTIPSNHSVDDTVAKLKDILKAKGITLFAVIDHSGEAAKVGLKMPNTKLLIFGNPKGGTPLMLKILIAEDAQGKVWISYNSPEYLKDRHGLPENLVQNIAVVGALAEKAAE